MQDHVNKVAYQKCRVFKNLPAHMSYNLPNENV